MRVMAAEVERQGPDRLIVRVEIDVSDPEATDDEEVGEGPTGSAIPDRIVRHLIHEAPNPVTLPELQAAVGGNPATVNRQAWTLATNAADLQLRLRGWVRTSGRGRYELTPAARRRLGGDLMSAGAAFERAARNQRDT